MDATSVCGGGDGTNANEERQSMELLEGYSTFDDFIKNGTALLAEATKMSQALPSGRKWNLLNTYTSFPQTMNEEGERVLNLLSLLLKNQKVKGKLVNRCVEEQMDVIIDANDTILDRADANLDSIEGIRQNPGLDISGSPSTPQISGSWNDNRRLKENILNSSRTSLSPVSSSPTYKLVSNRNIERPQIKYKYNIDNSSEPFKPKLTEKPNALKPLAILLDMDEDGECYSHPYQYELDLFKPSASQLKEVEAILYKPLDDTPLIYVEHLRDLQIVLDDLKKYSEIAIDLEHHNYRTFQGLTCLMQISTRDTDYIIDCLILRDKLQCLNEIFTDPKVVKVLHGADSDIEWLQRDLGLYIVNMFDTHKASQVLNFPRLSLAYLLQHYCNVTANKQYQLADWRVRPLPEELLKYAREDTHYLLYIYDKLRNRLLEAGNGDTNILLSVIQQSTDICKKRYKKPVLRENDHMELYRRSKKLFDNQQLFALRELYKWRDTVARNEDESLGYVLPNHMMLKIAEDLPREMQGLLACCSPIPHHVRKNLVHLHEIVNSAKKQPIVKPVFEEEVRTRAAAPSFQDIKLEGPLHCPHDLSHVEDLRDDMPTLIKESASDITSSPLLNSSPIVTVFEPTQVDNDDGVNESSESVKLVKFMSPYERYKKVRPYVDSQKAQEIHNEIDPSTANDNDDDTALRIERLRQHYLQTVNADHNADVSTECNLTTQAVKKENENNSCVLVKQELPEPLRKKVTKKRKHSKEKLSTEPDDIAQEPRKKKSITITAVTETSSSTDATVISDNKKENKKKKEKRISKNKKEKKSKGQEFEPFDYSTVDYNRFCGGSSVKTSHQISKPKFKRKIKKNKLLGKINSKSMTFGNII